MKFAVIQIRGTIHVAEKIIDTLNMLRLTRKNSCTIVEGTPENLGMIIKIKDLVTWGEINNETFRMLIEKRGRLPANKQLTEEYLKEKTKMNFDLFTKSFMEGKIKLKEVPGLKPYFRLKPPTGGFDKNGIKTPYSLGGALGYRKDDINNLIRRMI